MPQLVLVLHPFVEGPLYRSNKIIKKCQGGDFCQRGINILACLVGIFSLY